MSWLNERFSPELLFVVFMAADHVHHLAWPDWEQRGRESSVAEVYRILDASLGELLDAVGASDAGTCSSSPTTAAARSTAS